MKRLLLSLLFFINTLFASSFVKEVYILEDNTSLNFENIKSNTNFKKTTKSIQRETLKEYWFKIILDEKEIQNSGKDVLKIYSKFNTNDIIFDKNTQKLIFDERAIKLNLDRDNTIYFKVQNNERYITINFKFYTQKELFEKNRFHFIVYAIAYGILFSAFLYYLAFFIFNRQKSFIYYSLAQLSMLLLLSVEINDFEFLNDIFIVCFLVLAILFTKEFLNTKKYTPKINKILNFVIYFYIIDFFLEGYIGSSFPASLFLLFLLIAALLIYSKTKSKPILFYLGAWSIMVLSFIFIDFQFFFAVIKIDMPYELFVHIIAPLESLILAFSLSYKMKLLEEEKLKAERMMVHQNKLAAMGEMISNIAHQWRQPLTHLSYIFMNISTAYKKERLDEKYLNKKTKEATNQLEYMSNTIDDFKDFYLPKTQKENFKIKDSVSNALSIISSTLETNHIKVQILGEDRNIKGYKSEFSQVILNLISNAKDALIENKIKEPKITILLDRQSIDIYDNAGGIDLKIKDKIFEPYFTNKQKGSGIGLYMSKIIIENHFNGKLSHQNKNDGSYFKIEL